VGLKRCEHGKHGNEYERPQSNQRGIETLHTHAPV